MCTRQCSGWLRGKRREGRDRACRGLRIADDDDLDPLATAPPPTHPELDPANLGFTIWDLERNFVTGGLAGTREATLVHMIDNLGGKLGSFDRLEKQLPDGSRWSGYDRVLGGGAYFAARDAA
jgi:hypothetical protein